NVGNDRAYNPEAKADAKCTETNDRRTDECAYRRNGSDDGHIVRKEISGVPRLTFDCRPFRFWLQQDPLNPFHEIHDTPPLIRGLIINPFGPPKSAPNPFPLSSWSANWCCLR